MIIVKKMYRVFDELHATKAGAEAVLKGWEHKEKIYPVFAVGHESDLTEHVTELQGVYLAKTEAEAMEECAEWNA